MIPGRLLLFYSPFSSKKLLRVLNAAEKECGRNDERKETERNKKYNTNKEEKNCN
jgi:hypothetical protein